MSGQVCQKHLGLVNPPPQSPGKDGLVEGQVKDELLDAFVSIEFRKGGLLFRRHGRLALGQFVILVGEGGGLLMRGVY